MFLKSFEQKITFQKIKPYKIDFKQGINLIVGNNGTGKSTMLRLLNTSNILATPNDIELILNNPNEIIDTRFFDSEKDNPAIKNSGNESMFEVMSHFKSHGETVLPIIEYIGQMQKTIIMLDEPEAGISLRNQQKLVKVFEQATLYNQLIIATHSYVLIKSQEQVYNMKSKKWITSKQYLKGI